MFHSLRSYLDGFVQLPLQICSRIANGRVIFCKSAIDQWISQGDVNEYSKYVSTARSVSDILPESYKPPTQEQRELECIREIHENLLVSMLEKMVCRKKIMPKG